MRGDIVRLRPGRECWLAEPGSMRRAVAVALRSDSGEVLILGDDGATWERGVYWNRTMAFRAACGIETDALNLPVFEK